VLEFREGTRWLAATATSFPPSGGSHGLADAVDALFVPDGLGCLAD
jgi:hypothetical protein